MGICGYNLCVQDSGGVELQDASRNCKNIGINLLLE